VGIFVVCGAGDRTFFYKIADTSFTKVPQQKISQPRPGMVSLVFSTARILLYFLSEPIFILSPYECRYCLVVIGLDTL